MNVSAGLRGEFARRAAEIVQHRDFAGLSQDMVDRVQPQPIEAIIAQPGQRVLDRKGAHLRYAIIDRAAPWRLRVGEEARRIAAEKISLRPEVVIDHVEKHHQPSQMRFVDQVLEVFGPAIGAVWRVPQHAVIAPIALAREVRQRHQFECRDPGRHQMIELVDHRAIAAFAGEGADVGLDQDGVLPRPPAPVARAPCIGVVIDQLAGAEHVVGLKRGGGIGHVDLAVNPEFVMRTGGEAGDVGREPAVAAARHCLEVGLWLVQHQLDAPGGRCPQAKRCAVRCAILGQPRTELPRAHAIPAKASTEREGALASAPDAKSALACVASVVFNTCRQVLYSLMTGNLNAISSGAALRTTKIGPCSLLTGPSTYARNRPSGNFQSSWVISAADGVSHNTP